jgi:hypothetical protein
MKKKPVEQIVLLLKVLLFTFIMLSPLMTVSKYLAFLNHSIAKVGLLAMICLFCFIDFQLALIATVAFLVLIINLNNNILVKMQRDQFTDNKNSLLDAQFAPPITIPEVKMTTNIVCQNQQPRNDVNEDMLSHYIDDKIKPYDVFIRMMTNEDALGKAQGDHL